jgi:hypothetical protein
VVTHQSDEHAKSSRIQRTDSTLLIKITANHNVVIRYSAEYGRWSTWTPDDPATQEEAALKEVSTLYDCE